MLADPAAERARRRIAVLCHGGLDAASLLRRLAGEVQPVVGYDGAVWATTDPATALITGAHVEDLPRGTAPAFYENEYLHDDVNTFSRLARGVRPVATLSEATGGDLSRSRLQHELGPVSGLVGDSLRAAFVSGGACWGVASLARRDPRAPFGQADVSFIASLVTHVAEGLRAATLLRALAAPRPARRARSRASWSFRGTRCERRAPRGRRGSPSWRRTRPPPRAGCTPDCWRSRPRRAPPAPGSRRRRRGAPSVGRQQARTAPAGGGRSNHETAVDVVAVSARRARIMGIRITAVRDRLFLGGRLAERTTDWYAQDAGGAVWYLGEETAEPRDGRVVGREGSWRAGTGGARGGIVMPSEPRRGAEYRQELLPGHAEDRARIQRLRVPLAVGPRAGGRRWRPWSARRSSRTSWTSSSTPAASARWPSARFAAEGRPSP